MLDPDGDSDRLFGDTRFAAGRFGHRGVTHRLRVLDQRLHPPQRLSKGEECDLLKDFFGSRSATGDVKAEHGPKTILLPLSQFMTRM